MPYAQRTKVSADKTAGEIEKLVRAYGAKGFMRGWQAIGASGGVARVEFVAYGRHIRFIVEVPANEQAARGRWRVLYLMVKAKLVAVEAKAVTFEEAFFGDIVMPESGKTVYQTARDHVRLSYEKRKDQPLQIGVDP